MEQIRTSGILFSVGLLLASFATSAQAPPKVNLTIHAEDGETITSNMHGFQTIGFFQHCKQGEECWQYFVDVAPSILRFPAGTDSKFAHPLSGVGYGYDGTQIDAFLTMYHNGPSAEHGDWVTKVDNNDEAGGLYIDTLIQLVQDIENTHGKEVGVLYVANILTAGPAEMIAVLQYLISAGITVAGVEIGNEVYSEDIIFHTFEEYYGYVQGTDLPINNDDLITYLNAPGHDFIHALRTHLDPQIRALPVGLCAAPPAYLYDPASGPQDIPTVTPLNKFNRYVDWNNAIGSYWDDKKGYNQYGTHKVFDAFVVHPYYKQNLWEHAFGNYTAFFNGIPSIPQANFEFDQFDNAFLRNAYFNAQREILHYTTLAGSGGTGQLLNYLTGSFHLDNSQPTNHKKVWFTEWNILALSDEMNLLSNTWVHSMYVFNWVNALYAANFDTRYTKDFLQYAVYHTAQGSPVVHRNLIGATVANYDVPLSSCPGEVDPCEEDFRRRMQYYPFHLLKDIPLLGLKWAPHTRSGAADLANYRTYTYHDGDVAYTFLDQSVPDAATPLTYSWPGKSGIEFHPAGGGAVATPRDISVRQCFEVASPTVPYMGNGANPLTMAHAGGFFTNGSPHHLPMTPGMWDAIALAPVPSRIPVLNYQQAILTHTDWSQLVPNNNNPPGLMQVTAGVRPGAVLVSWIAEGSPVLPGTVVQVGIRDLQGKEIVQPEHAPFGAQQVRLPASLANGAYLATLRDAGGSLLGTRLFVVAD